MKTLSTKRESFSGREIKVQLFDLYHLTLELKQKEHHTFLWNKHNVSQYFEDRNIGESALFSCETQFN